MFQFADLTLARRLERAEGNACLQFAVARRTIFPECGAAWMECGGAVAVFDRVESPVTQTFGLGIFEDLSGETLDALERFFLDRGAPVVHEVSPLAGVPALTLLCDRGYRPVEISNVMYRAVEAPAVREQGNVRARAIAASEMQIWADISARGWASEHPEFRELLSEFGVVSSAREHSLSFLGEVDGAPGAAGVLCLHEGVALFGGSSTVPELRRRGLQAVLLEERMRCAFEHGCDLAMMVAEAGSNSQRNAERKGFRVAYTRTKWRLSRGAG